MTDEKPARAAMFPVRLLKNYVPAEGYEIVGHHRPQIIHKDSAGKPVVIQEAAFIRGEAMPPPASGVGCGDKLWAGTVLKMPTSEAKACIAGKIAERADELPG